VEILGEIIFCHPSKTYSVISHDIGSIDALGSSCFNAFKMYELRRRGACPVGALGRRGFGSSAIPHLVAPTEPLSPLPLVSRKGREPQVVMAAPIVSPLQMNE